MTSRLFKLLVPHKAWYGLLSPGLGLLAFLPQPALAHPMGNFSISHYAGIRIEPNGIEVHYILDMAEIPTFQEMQETGVGPKPGDPETNVYLARKAEALGKGLLVTLNGRPLFLQAVSQDVIFPPGAGGMPTLKIGVVYQASLGGATCPCALDYRDENLPDRAGWKEIVVNATSGAKLLSSTAASVSRSRELADYPTDLINSPPQELAARVTFAPPAMPTSSDGLPGPRSASSAASPPSLPPSSSAGIDDRKGARHPDSSRVMTAGAPAVSPRVALSRVAAAPASALALTANKQGTPHNRFTELITSNQWSLWFLLTAAMIAAALGGLHALEPGHGKTIVAAYLVGSQGTAAHALLLGLIVTATHTAGVYALGLITLYASRYIVPDHLYPWLGVVSGLTIAGLGLYMLRGRWAGRHHHHHHRDHHHALGQSHAHLDSTGHEHGHAHDHSHGHGSEHAHHHHHVHSHDLATPDRSETGPGSVSYRQLLTLGVTGGIVPCPAALVVLLSAVSLHRIAFGLYLIVAFSLGLAAVLISIGLVTVYARGLLAGFPSDGPVISRWLPMASAAVITCLGAGITIQAVMAMGVIPIRL